jgi:hypothetical protein
MSFLCIRNDLAVVSCQGGRKLDSSKFLLKQRQALDQLAGKARVSVKMCQYFFLA